MLLMDSTDRENDAIPDELPADIDVTLVFNKIDLSGQAPRIVKHPHRDEIYLSAKTGAGLDLLKQYLKSSVGFGETADNVFIARRRHLQALSLAQQAVENAGNQLKNQAPELVAEDLRQAQTSLSEITGEFTSDDLLGEIFGSFCIGK